MKIETNGVVLRTWEENDAEELAKVANNKKIFDNLRDSFPQPYSLQDAADFISLSKENGNSLLLAIEIQGKVVGNVGVFFKNDVYRKNAELGYFLSEEHWGKGIMTKAIKKVVEYCFENYEINRIYAEPFASNIGSIKVLERAGFKLEALLKSNIIKNGVIGDTCIFSLLKNEYM